MRGRFRNIVRTKTIPISPFNPLPKTSKKRGKLPASPGINALEKSSNSSGFQRTIHQILVQNKLRNSIRI
jgi:hypothetical protein